MQFWLRGPKLLQSLCIVRIPHFPGLEGSAEESGVISVCLCYVSSRFQSLYVCLFGEEHTSVCRGGQRTTCGCAFSLPPCGSLAPLPPEPSCLPSLRSGFCLLCSLGSLCVCVFLHVCLCNTFMHCPCSPAGGSNPLELASQTIVNHHVGAGNQPWALWKSRYCS